MKTPYPPAELRQLALQALTTADFQQKVVFAHTLRAQAATISIATDMHIDAVPGIPGCPDRPLLQAQLSTPRRSPHQPDGLAALLHAVAHIEFNAINLALDAVWRFSSMPQAYYRDWARVAAEEADHFSLLQGLLEDMGYSYGDFPAHTGLWDMTQKTEGDVLARMALVPRTLEARGLDATPPMQAKLRKVGTPHALQAVAVLETILRDEIGHVAIGNHWYRFVCDQRGLDPVATYPLLASRYGAPRLKGPLNLAARAAAGFAPDELLLLGAEAGHQPMPCPATAVTPGDGAGHAAL